MGVIGLANKLLKRYVEKHEKIVREKEKERWINVLIENDVSEEDISRSSGLSIEEILHYKKNCPKKIFDELTCLMKEWIMMKILPN